MMLSSSAALVGMSLSISVDVLACLFIVYVIWTTLVVVFLRGLSGRELNGLGRVFYFCILLISVPCSFSVFYKLLMGVCIYSCYAPVFFCWVLYRISEQFYLVKFLIDTSQPRGVVGSLRLV